MTCWEDKLPLDGCQNVHLDVFVVLPLVSEVVDSHGWHHIRQNDDALVEVHRERKADHAHSRPKQFKGGRWHQMVLWCIFGYEDIGDHQRMERYAPSHLITCTEFKNCGVAQQNEIFIKGLSAQFSPGFINVIQSLHAYVQRVLRVLHCEQCEVIRSFSPFIGILNLTQNIKNKKKFF